MGEYGFATVEANALFFSANSVMELENTDQRPEDDFTGSGETHGSVRSATKPRINPKIKIRFAAEANREPVRNLAKWQHEQTVFGDIEFCDKNLMQFLTAGIVVPIINVLWFRRLKTKLLDLPVRPSVKSISEKTKISPQSMQLVSTTETQVRTAARKYFLLCWVQ